MTTCNSMATASNPSPRATRKSRIGVLSFQDSIAVFNECIDIFGADCLRGSNFPEYMTISATAFDPEDQHVALKTYVDQVNAAADQDDRVNKLRINLEGFFGPIDRPFAATLRGFKYHIVPKVCVY